MLKKEDFHLLKMFILKMKENIIEAQYDITKKTKIRKFYEAYKILIFSSVLVITILFGSIGYYYNLHGKKKILLSENFVKAKIYFEEEKKDKAVNLLKSLVYENDNTYSTLALFFLINKNLIDDYNEVPILFNHILDNNDYKKEIKDLIIYKKILLDINNVSESEILEQMKPLLNNGSIWKPHALLILGDFFLSKEEHLKAKEFYTKILAIKNLQQDIYNQAKFQLAAIK